MKSLPVILVSLGLSQGFQRPVPLVRTTSAPWLCATMGKEEGTTTEGTVKVSRGDDSFALSYKIYNADAEKTPLVVNHGGP